LRRSEERFDEMARNIEAVETAHAEAAALRKAALALSRNLAMDSMLDALLECISSLVPFDTAAVLLREGEEELMVAREAPGGRSNRTGLVVKASQSAHMQKILFEQKPILIPDTTGVHEWRSTPAHERSRSWLGLPLIARGQVVGVLSLGSRTASRFSLEHLRLTRSLAVSAAVAIENARVRERAEIYAASLGARLHDLS